MTLDWEELKKPEKALMAVWEMQEARTSELYRFLVHPNTLVGSTAAAELVRRKVPDAYEKLIDIVVTHPTSVVHALKELGDPRAAVGLSRALPFASGLTWLDVLETLVHLGSQDAVPGLIDALNESNGAGPVHILSTIVKLNAVPLLSRRWGEITSGTKKAYLEHVFYEGEAEYFRPLYPLFAEDSDETIAKEARSLREQLEAEDAF